MIEILDHWLIQFVIVILILTWAIPRIVGAATERAIKVATAAISKVPKTTLDQAIGAIMWSYFSSKKGHDTIDTFITKKLKLQ